MKTNDEIVEEFRKRFTVPNDTEKMSTETVINELITPATYEAWLRTILTQKDAEVAEAVQKLRTEEPLYIGKTQYEFYKGDVRWVYNQALDDLITGLTPHPTDDTSDKSK